LSQTWERLRTWFAREYPELGDTLNWGILPEDLAQIENQFGFALPGPVRESYLITDGQEPESSAGCSEGLFFGLVLLPLEDVLEEWRFWRGVDNDPSTGGNARLRDSMQSIPGGWVRREYSLKGWIPLVSDRTGNYIGVDLNPAGGGVAGQVIVFGRDFDTKVVLWKGDGASGWAKWLASFADDLEAGDGFEMGVNENSEGSEDDLGYESYFHDGNGHGSGDGGGSTGGMRLAGEYKGWNTLEALADRSLRKWHEQGYIPDLPVEQEKSKRVSNLLFPKAPLIFCFSELVK
jgi:cell wall assembly regulator SMI1